MNTPKYVKPAAIRRAITILHNAGLIDTSVDKLTNYNGKLAFTFIIDSDLIQPKKKLKK